MLLGFTGLNVPDVNGCGGRGDTGGGSVASSAFGLPRSTLDVDLVAVLEAEHVDDLVADSATLRCGFAIMSFAATSYANVDIRPERA